MLPRLNLKRSTPEQAAHEFNDRGVLWIEDLFAREFVQTLADAYQRRYSSLSLAELAQRHAMVGDGRYMITVRVKRPFNSPALYANSTLLPLLDRLLGNHYLISSFGSVVAFPATNHQPVHFDYPPLFESAELCTSLPPYAITLAVPLVDLDEATGSTAVWPGSHRDVNAREQLQALSEAESIDGGEIPLPKMGDAFLMDFRLMHAGTTNHSRHPRPLLYIVYSRPWFREDMNFAEQPAIDISDKQRAKIPKKHRHLFAGAARDAGKFR